MIKQTITSGIGILLFVTFVAVMPAEHSVNDIKELEIGATAPKTEHEVKDVSGKMLTLSEVSREKGLLVIFSCNTCPWVDKWENRYNPIAELAAEKKIGMIALNPNTQYRERGDSFEDMKKRSEKENYKFYYAIDKDNVLADAFGATRTPHVFLFDENMKLVYRGAIDDNANSAENVNDPYLKNAINQMAAGEKITTQATKSLGCTIKRTR